PHPAARVHLGVEGNGGAPDEPRDAAEEPAAGVAVAVPDPEAGAGAVPEQAPYPVEGTGPQISLEQFEGPLDLLLFLIREEKVDITDIPIARITDQYLATIGDLEQLDLDKAGEYLVMAATLMRIKSRMLIPRDEEEDEEDEDDPRLELVRRLTEYREYKRIAESLQEREDEWRGLFARAASPIPEIEEEEDGWEDPGVSLVDLFRSFRGILVQAESEIPLHMQTESFSLAEQMDFIRTECARVEDGVSFHGLFEGMASRALLITTFLALLEVIRGREIVAHQIERFGDIWLKRATEEASTHE
ncbi:segregation/condensation protein A, partial [bacterium]|nr:segregation/condensation protein A [bacterium]